MKERAESADIEKLRVYFWLKAERSIVEDFGRLAEPVFPETLEDWLGHPLTVGLTPKEMSDLRAKLEQLRGVRHTNRRLDGKPRRKLAPPPRPRMKP